MGRKPKRRVQGSNPKRSVRHGVFRDPISAKLMSQPRPADPASMGKLDPLVAEKCEHGKKPKKCKACISSEEA